MARNSLSKPFRFLDSAAAITLLRQRLARLELTEQKADAEEYGTADPNHPVCMRFSCPWLGSPVELHWDYGWWPDGTNSALEKVSAVYEGKVRGEIDVTALLGQRLERPLAEVVIERIDAYCAELTGKHQA